MLVYRASAAVALRALVDALQSDRPLDHVLRELLAQVRGFLAADEAYVLLRQGDHLVVRAANGLPRGARGRTLDLRSGIEGTAGALRETIVVADAGGHRLFLDPFGRAAPPGAMVATPLLMRGRESGVLVAARRQPGRFDEASIWWLELLSGLAAVVVAQDEAVRFQEHRARQAELLLGMAEIGADEPAALLRELTAVVRRGLAADRVELLLHDPDRRELVPLGRTDQMGGTGSPVPVASDHPAARAFASGQPVVAAVSETGPLPPRTAAGAHARPGATGQDAEVGASGPRPEAAPSLDGSHAGAADAGLRRADETRRQRPRDRPAASRAGSGSTSVAALPIRIGSEPRGVLYLASRDAAAFGADDLAFLALVAARVGVLLEREEIRRRRADTRAREELIGVVSHELKTPVAVMRAYLELLEKRAERDGRTQDREVLQSVTGQTTRMLAMIEELLDVQRIEAGVLRLELSRFDLGEMVQRVAAELALTSDGHRIAVEAPEPIIASADRRRVEEVVTNLLENAIKYSPAGGEIRVTLERAGERARVAVRDQGVGIAPEDQARVFDRFYRVPGTGERLHKGHHGLGLGLYIARELVERHGGEMGVDSPPGDGATFWFTLPLDGAA